MTVTAYAGVIIWGVVFLLVVGAIIGLLIYFIPPKGRRGGGQGPLASPPSPTTPATRGHVGSRIEGGPGAGETSFGSRRPTDARR